MFYVMCSRLNLADILLTAVKSVYKTQHRDLYTSRDTGLSLIRWQTCEIYTFSVNVGYKSKCYTVIIIKISHFKLILNGLEV